MHPRNDTTRLGKLVFTMNDNVSKLLLVGTWCRGGTPKCCKICPSRVRMKGDAALICIDEVEAPCGTCQGGEALGVYLRHGTNLLACNNITIASAGCPSIIEVCYLLRCLYIMTKYLLLASRGVCKKTPRSRPIPAEHPVLCLKRSIDSCRCG